MECFTEEQLIKDFSSSGQRVIIATDHGAGGFLSKFVTLMPVFILSSLLLLLHILLTALCCMITHFFIGEKKKSFLFGFRNYYFRIF